MVFFISQQLLQRIVWSDVTFIWFTTARAAAHPRFTAFWLQMCRLALAAHRSRWYKSKLPPMHIMNVLCIWSDTSHYKHMTMCQLTDDEAQHSFNASKVRPSAFSCLAACLNTCNHHLTLISMLTQKFCWWMFSIFHLNRQATCVYVYSKRSLLLGLLATSVWYCCTQC